MLLSFSLDAFCAMGDTMPNFHPTFMKEGLFLLFNVAGLSSVEELKLSDGG